MNAGVAEAYIKLDQLCADTVKTEEDSHYLQEEEDVQEEEENRDRMRRVDRLTNDQSSTPSSHISE